MARIPAVDPGTASGEAKTLLDAVQAKLGMTPNFLRVLAHSPAALGSFLGLFGIAEQGSLDPQTRERIALALAEQNACEYCLSAHTAIGRSTGLTGDEMEANRQGTSQDAKAAAAQILVEATRWAGSSFVDVRLPNIFAEHGRPYYNSVVATFCARLASGQAPEVHQDRELELMHATDAAAQLLGLEATPPTTSITVAELAARLTEFATVYRTGDMPALRSRFDVRLFNTYRSFLPPAPVPLPRRGDARGELVEAVRVRGGTGQTFCSTTRPGYTRGDHVHLAKVERFVVLRGEARITLRRLLHDEVVELRVTGDTPVAVDMPALWAHAITNVGSEELVTLFWANELFDPAAPDTYPEPVALSRPGVATSGPSGGSRP